MRMQLRASAIISYLYLVKASCAASSERRVCCCKPLTNGSEVSSASRFAMRPLKSAHTVASPSVFEVSCTMSLPCWEVSSACAPRCIAGAMHECVERRDEIRCWSQANVMRLRGLMYVVGMRTPRLLNGRCFTMVSLIVALPTRSMCTERKYSNVVRGLCSRTETRRHTE